MSKVNTSGSMAMLSDCSGTTNSTSVSTSTDRLTSSNQSYCLPLMVTRAMNRFCHVENTTSGIMMNTRGLNAATSQLEPTAGCSLKKKRNATRNPASPRMKNPVMSSHVDSLPLRISTHAMMQTNTSRIRNVASGERGKSAVCSSVPTGGMVVFPSTIFVCVPSAC